MTRLTKIKDTKFNGKHPNMILEGMHWHSKNSNHPKPVVGERFHFGTIMDHSREHLWTSTVTKINEDGTFNTNNSIYKLEYTKKINYGN